MRFPDGGSGDGWPRIAGGSLRRATAPVTVAGSTVTANAEILAGIVMLQLMRPGMRIEVKDFTYPHNMRTGAPAFANIGVSLHGVVFSQIWRRYGIPAGMTTAYPSSKIPDFQCGYEKAIIALIAALSGINLQLVQGAIHGELAHHPVQAIIDDDLVGMIGRFLEGVEVSDETIALDLIAQVGPIPGEYLSKEHTPDVLATNDFLLAGPTAAGNTVTSHNLSGQSVATVEARCIEKTGTSIPALSDAANHLPQQRHVGPPPARSGYSLRYFEVRRYGVTATSTTGNSQIQVGVWKVFNKF